jgi:hypothetical protein
MMRRIIPLIALLLFFAYPAAAQESNATRETLLYRKAAGPYIVTVQGERLIDRSYLEISVQHDGQPVSPDTVVTVQAEPHAGGNITDVLEETQMGLGTAHTYTAQYEDGVFRIAPMTFDATSSWMLSITVDGESGQGTTTLPTRIYPRKPDNPIAFTFVNIGIPFVTLTVLLGFFYWRKIPLVQAPD